MKLELDEGALARAIAEQLKPLLKEIGEKSEGKEGWLDSKAASAYLGISRNALYKIAATGLLGDCAQIKEGGKYFFKREQLDAFRRGEESEN